MNPNLWLENYSWDRDSMWIAQNLAEFNELHNNQRQK